MNKIYTGLLIALFLLALSSCGKDDEQSIDNNEPTISECTEGVWLLVEACDLNTQGQVTNCSDPSDENCSGAPSETNHWDFKTDGSIIANYEEECDNNNHICINYNEGTWFYTNDKLTITISQYYDCKEDVFIQNIYRVTGTAICNDNEFILTSTGGSNNFRIRLVRP